MLEYLNSECPADSRAIPEFASGDAALVFGCNLLHKRRMSPQSGWRKNRLSATRTNNPGRDTRTRSDSVVLGSIPRAAEISCREDGRRMFSFSNGSVFFHKAASAWLN
jgi:hypothetical protein